MIKTSRFKKLKPPTPLKRSVGKAYNLNKGWTDEQIDSFLSLCLHWCKTKFGKKRGNLPQILWKRNDRELQQDRANAEYFHEHNTMWVRIQGHRNCYNLANTIIHEYIHYLQPNKGGWYWRYMRTHGYEKHPYEIEATYLAGLWDSYCTHWVMDKMGKKGRF